MLHIHASDPSLEAAVLDYLGARTTLPLLVVEVERESPQAALSAPPTPPTLLDLPRTLRDYLREVLTRASAPQTTREVVAAVRRLGRQAKPTSIYNALRLLRQEGVVVTLADGRWAWVPPGPATS